MARQRRRERTALGPPHSPESGERVPAWVPRRAGERGALDAGALVRMTDLSQALENLPPRLLVRTCRRFPLTQFDDQLTAFDPDTLAQLADLGVQLVGIDSASIDPADSKTLPSHQVIRQRGLRVLENLFLDDVPEGDYELIALPLKLMTADASPVRAVLREL